MITDKQKKVAGQQPMENTLPGPCSWYRIGRQLVPQASRQANRPFIITLYIYLLDPLLKPLHILDPLL